ncbi:MAG: response regulator [Candidatus Thermoplasmatota archaeon]|nr:response regulator [Candidatus Thermoplasmatota archaeon]
MKVLIADGDPISRLSVTKMLDMENVKYIEAADGKAALNAYIKDPDLDMVVVEWDLMGRDGLEVTRSIREYDERSKRDCYIVVVSERTGKWDIQKAVEMGADDFITKPFNKNVINDRLSTGYRHLGSEMTMQTLRSMDPIKHLIDEHDILRFQANKLKELLEDIDEEAPYKLVKWMSGGSFVLETDMHQDKEASFSVAFLDRIAREQRVRFMSYTDSTIATIEKEHKELEELVREVRDSFMKFKEEMENPDEYSKDFNIMEHTDDYPAYCVKCKKKVEIQKAELFMMENDMHAFKGKCPDCGTNVTRIIGKSIGVQQKHIVLKKALKEYISLLTSHLKKEEQYFFPFVNRYLTPGDKERLIEHYKRIEDKHGISRLGKQFKAT